MNQQKRTKKQIQQEYSEALQQEARREKQEVIDAVNVAAANARKEVAARQAVEDARLAGLRKQNEIDAENRLRQAIAAKYTALSKADFERLFPKLRDEYLLERSRELQLQRREEYAQYI